MPGIVAYYHWESEHWEVSMSKKILVVDDEPDVLTFLTALLKDAGYEVLTAKDGIEALQVAKQEKPDLISLDLAMPNNTGTEFYRKMQKDKQIAQTPVIIVSGLAGRHLAVRKPVAVFDKPIDRDLFLEAVRDAIGG
jgi:CheY-like chemotaxis protein